MGYRVVDRTKGLLGTVSGLEEYPMQTLFRIRREEKEILIPVHEDLILSIDPEKKEIVMELPEGIEEL
jgi:16S rRNA processing protein RimM